ncbi:MAG: hypothetical protein ABI376_03755 [Caulobacteraceae bacterium]
MGDRVFFLLIALAAAAAITLALVWPQGIGAPSPPPFDHRLDHGGHEPAAAPAV